jgi:hypothetical protein
MYKEHDIILYYAPPDNKRRHYPQLHATRQWQWVDLNRNVLTVSPLISEKW